MTPFNTHPLRSPDVDDLSSLDMPAGQIDASFPRLAPGQYKMLIRKPENVRNKKDTADMLVFKLETTEDARDTEENKLYKGFGFTHRISGPSGDRNAQALAKDLAGLLQAVEGKGSTTKPIDLWKKPELIADKPVWVKVGINKATEEFPESNKVVTFIPPEKIQK